MLDHRITEKQQAVEAIRRFVEREVRPSMAGSEGHGSYPEELVQRMRQLGLFGLTIPEAHGGLGLSLSTFVAVMTELAAGWTTLAAYVNSHSTVAYILSQHGTPEQRERYLPPMASGELHGALALTESDAGSDLQAIRTTARREAEGLRLSGNKIFVTNGERASLLLVLAKTDPDAKPPKRGMSLFLVEKDTPGVEVAGTYQKMAYEQVDTCEILLGDVLLPTQALLGPVEGRGLNQLLDGLEVGRLAIAASAVGLGSAALAEAVSYAQQRHAFGVPIAQHQAVQLRIAEMATKLTAARLLTEEAARAKESGGRADMLSGMAKLFASETGLDLVTDALRIHGGYGYIKGLAVERLFREAPLYIVGEGTNDIQKLVIARRLLAGEARSALGLPL